VLPATVWNKFMTYAHNGIDLKPIPYVESETPPIEELVADANGDLAPDGASGISDVPGNLSSATTERLIALEKLMRDAPPLRPFAGLWPPSPVGLTGAQPVVEKPTAVLPMEPIGPPPFPIIP
jgi:penicillin-binding protein 1A